MNLVTPISNSQAANSLSFSASQSYVLNFNEENYYINGREVPFKKGDRMSGAKLNLEAEHHCREEYSSPTLSVKSASGDLTSHKLLQAISILNATWTISSDGKNIYRVKTACKQWGTFSIPNSDGYQFSLKRKSIDPKAEKLSSSPWYSKTYLSENNWKVNYWNNFGEGTTLVELLRQRWLPRTELPPMPTIRLERIYFDPKYPDQPLASLAIIDGAFASPKAGGWNKLTFEINSGIGSVFVPYTASPNFHWPFLTQDEFFTRTFEIRMMQAGYRYSSQVGKFVIAPVGENIQVRDVHRTPDGQQVEIYCKMEC